MCVPVTLHNLSAGYDRHPAVHHVSGQFPDASMTAIVGPNGGGKSTLLKCLAGFVPPMTGHIDFGGLSPRDIAYLPQQFEIDRTFPISVLETVMLGHWPRTGAWGRYTARHRAEAMDALALVGMRDFAARPVVSLSTGQWQRVLFARLSLQRAKLILLDEPFAAIDGRTTHDLLHVLEQWQGAGRTIICVMHDFALVRDHFPQTMLLARDLVAWGVTAAVMNDANLARATASASHWDDRAGLCAVDKGAA
ncbi:MAG: ABC transporter ATP-binding protein [Alphaproteobacteria bacterium]|nr:ABC transporter ATP-binding protein [Alphaproteobacteria bacterium]